MTNSDKTITSKIETKNTTKQIKNEKQWHNKTKENYRLMGASNTAHSETVHEKTQWNRVCHYENMPFKIY